MGRTTRVGNGQANLSGANLNNADLGDANLNDADLSGADLGDAKVTEGQLKEVESLEGAKMTYFRTDTRSSQAQVGISSLR